MKQCTKCRQWKNAEDFYHSVNGSADSLTAWCRQCMKELSTRRQSARQRNEAVSTAIAQTILAKRGIPCVTGRSAGMKWVDLLAWGCVPIEAKSATSAKVEHLQFIWTFSPRQSQIGLVGFAMLIADLGDQQFRTFVVPVGTTWLAPSGAVSRGTSLSITLDSEHGNADNWRRLRTYEGAFHLIEEARQRFSTELAQSESLDVSTIISRIF